MDAGAGEIFIGEPEVVAEVVTLRREQPGRGGSAVQGERHRLLEGGQHEFIRGLPGNVGVGQPLVVEAAVQLKIRLQSHMEINECARDETETDVAPADVVVVPVVCQIIGIKTSPFFIKSRYSWSDHEHYCFAIRLRAPFDIDPAYIPSIS